METIAIKMTNIRDFKKDGKYVKTLADIEVVKPGMMPKVGKYAVNAKDAKAFMRKVEKFAVTEGKKLKTLN